RQLHTSCPTRRSSDLFIVEIKKRTYRKFNQFHSLRFLKQKHRILFSVRHKWLNVKIARWNIHRRHFADNPDVMLLNANFFGSFAFCGLSEIRIEIFFLATRQRDLTTVAVAFVGTSYNQWEIPLIIFKVKQNIY